MPRRPTARPAGEHLAILARMLRQIELANYSDKRKRQIVTGIMTAMKELSTEMAEKKRPDGRQAKLFRDEGVI
jgi:hypothetical protein